MKRTTGNAPAHMRSRRDAFGSKRMTVSLATVFVVLGLLGPAAAVGNASPKPGPPNTVSWDGGNVAKPGVPTFVSWDG